MLEPSAAALNRTVQPVIKVIEMLVELIKRPKLGIAGGMRAFERASHHGVC